MTEKPIVETTTENDVIEATATTFTYSSDTTTDIISESTTNIVSGSTSEVTTEKEITTPKVVQSTSEATKTTDSKQTTLLQSATDSTVDVTSEPFTTIPQSTSTTIVDVETSSVSGTLIGEQTTSAGTVGYSSTANGETTTARESITTTQSLETTTDIFETAATNVTSLPIETTTIADLSTVTQQIPICPVGHFGNIPHPELCDTFYMCVGGVPIQLFCSDGFEYDENLEVREKN